MLFIYLFHSSQSIEKTCFSTFRDQGVLHGNINAKAASTDVLKISHIQTLFLISVLISFIETFVSSGSMCAYNRYFILCVYIVIKPVAVSTRAF